MSRCCASCAREVEAGQEICPHCLAPLATVDSRFTADLNGSFLRGGEGPASVNRLPDVEVIDFQPSSAVYRVVAQFRGGLISALIALLFIGVGGYWWIHSHRVHGQEQDLAGQDFFENEQYAAARLAWESAFDAFEKGLDDQGKTSALIGMSRCYIRTKDFSEALVVLQRAQKIQDDESVDDMIMKCHRMAAVEHLKLCQELFGPDSFGKAYLEAELAVDGFEKGEGTPSQKAGAYRMASRCSMELEDFDGAKNYLELAFDCEGKSDSNLALQKEYSSTYEKYRGQVMADAGKNGYIPQGKLDPIAIERAAAKNSEQKGYKRTGYSGYSGTRRTGYGSSGRTRYNRSNSNLILNHSTSIRTYQPPRRVSTTLGSNTSYPTYQKPDPYSSSRTYQQNYRNYQPYRPQSRSSSLGYPRNSRVSSRVSPEISRRLESYRRPSTYNPAKYRPPGYSTQFSSPSHSSPSFSAPRSSSVGYPKAPSYR